MKKVLKKFYNVASKNVIKQHHHDGGVRIAKAKKAFAKKELSDYESDGSFCDDHHNDDQDMQDLGLALYLLNKEVKNFYASSVEAKFLYQIKKSILKKYATALNAVHEFEYGGVGRLFNIGNFTFHNVYNTMEELKENEKFDCSKGAIEYNSITQSIGNSTNFVLNDNILTKLVNLSNNDIDINNVDVDFDFYDDNEINITQYLFNQIKKNYKNNIKNKNYLLSTEDDIIFDAIDDEIKKNNDYMLLKKTSIQKIIEEVLFNIDIEQILFDLYDDDTESEDYKSQSNSLYNELDYLEKIIND